MKAKRLHDFILSKTFTGLRHTRDEVAELSWLKERMETSYREMNSRTNPAIFQVEAKRKYIVYKTQYYELFLKPTIPFTIKIEDIHILEEGFLRLRIWPRPRFSDLSIFEDQLQKWATTYFGFKEMQVMIVPDDENL